MIFKTCNKCNVKFPINNFDKNKRSPDGTDYWCKPCRRSYFKKNYHSNLSKFRKFNNERRANRIDWLADLKKDKPCQDCGKSFEPYCMDFDHLDNKVKSVTRMVLDNAPKSKILKEIKKCDLVCVLCHGDRTQARFDKNQNKKYSKYSIRNIKIINDAKDTPCEICRQQYDSHNMHLDHIDPNTKYKNVSQLKNFAVDTLLSEIEKCQVLCSLCHRRKSIFEQRLKNYKNKLAPITKKSPFKGKSSKECSACNEILPNHKFTKHSTTKSGLGSWCKECFNKYRRERRSSKIST